MSNSLYRPVKKLVYLNSKNAEYNNNNDWVFTLNKYPTLRNVVGIQLQNLNFPWTWPNVTTYNNTLHITQINLGFLVTKTVSIPPGYYYSPLEIATALTTAIGSWGDPKGPALATCTVTYFQASN